MASESPLRRVLHVIGSSNDNFTFQVSYLYAKNCPQDVVPGVKYDYAIFVPPSNNNEHSVKQVTWFFIKDGKSTIDDLDDNVLLQASVNKNGTLLPPSVEGPMTTGAMLSRLEGLMLSGDSDDTNATRRYYDLMVPHCFCYQGMTLYRQLFEDLLRIPHPGPTWICNAIAQNKALTRNALAGCPGVHLPKGEVLMFQKGAEKEPPLPSLSVPFVVKPACEDNSRGVSLVRTEEEILPAMRKAFTYGTQVVVEEYIPGREIRAGCVESNDADGGLQVLSCKIEYVMNNADYPIRSETDKLTTVESEDNKNNKNSQLVQTKCDREYLTPNMKLASGPDVLPLSPETVTLMDNAVKNAHVKLESRDYTLLDFRVHEQTGIPYVIEACPFWTFTPISVLSLMADRSEEFFSDDGSNNEAVRTGTFKKVARSLWERTARRG